MLKSKFLSRLLPTRERNPRQTKLGNDVGVIGLGLIGSRVASRLRDAGCRVWVWSRSPQPVPNFLASAREVAEHAQAVQIFVSDGPALLAALENMKSALTPAHVIINSSTVCLEETRAAAALVTSQGAAFLDAPFTGSRDAAANGELVYYLGGDPDVAARVASIMAVSSRLILPVGAVGDATVIKLATNMISAATIEVLSEALAVIRASGVSIDGFQAALQENLANSGLSQLKLPAMLSKDFEPRFSLANMTKDMKAATTLAQSLGFPLPAISAFLSTAEHLSGTEDRAKDYSVVSEFFSPNRNAAAPPVSAPPAS